MEKALSLLAPLGWIYGFGASLRRQAYRRGVLRTHRLRSPVISVGALAMGGSMKTPSVIEIARALASRGPDVGILGHGYRGDTSGPLVVSDGEKPLETADKVGDEAVLLAHELPGCPVVIGKDKVAAGRLMEERFGRRILLVDSGFQHLRLHRDLDIVCATERDLGSRVLPAGRLREFPRSLNYADLVFTDQVTDGPRVAKLREKRPKDVFSLARASFGFYPADGTGSDVEPPACAFAFCGLGWPERFIQDLKAQPGVTVAAHRFFRDHHPYSEQDISDLASAAQTANATALVTTAKDAVRIQNWPGPLPLLVLAAQLQIDGLPQVLKRIDSVILARIRAGL